MVDEYVLPFIFSVSYCVLSHAMHLDKKAYVNELFESFCKTVPFCFDKVIFKVNIPWDKKCVKVLLNWFVPTRTKCINDQ